MSHYANVSGHNSMVFDDVRNQAYARALKEIIQADSVVLDLGAGLGIHGMVAASYGARHVYLVDSESIIEIASRAITKNGLQDNTTCLHGKIQEIDLPEKVDVIVSVFTGNFLLTEDLLPSLFYARDKYLKAGGQLVPNRAVMKIVPVSAEEFYRDQIDSWSMDSLGFDFSDTRSYVTNNIFYVRQSTMSADFLSEPGDLMELDFITAESAECRNDVTTTITEDGLCHGLLGWFDIRLGSEWLSTSPKSEVTHWSQAFLPLDPPIEVRAGDSFRIGLKRPANGEWTWTVKYGEQAQRHSTFLAVPLSTRQIRKKSEIFVPDLDRKGEAVNQLLSRIDGKRSVSELITELLEAFPDVLQNEEEARKFVIQIISWSTK